MGWTCGTAGTAVVRVVLKVIAKTVFTARLVRAVDATAVIAHAVFATIIVACAAVMHIHKLIGAEVIAHVFAFFTLGIGHITIRIFIRATACPFTADLAIETGFFAVTAVLGIAHHIDACMIANGLPFTLAGIDTGSFHAHLTRRADISAPAAVVIIRTRIKAVVIADNRVLFIASRDAGTLRAARVARTGIPASTAVAVGRKHIHAHAIADGLIRVHARLRTLAFDTRLTFGAYTAARAAVVAILRQHHAAMTAYRLGIDTAIIGTHGVDTDIAVRTFITARAAVKRIREHVDACFAATRQILAALNDAFAINTCLIITAYGVAIPTVLLIAINLDAIGTATELILRACAGRYDRANAVNTGFGRIAGMPAYATMLRIGCRITADIATTRPLAILCRAADCLHDFGRQRLARIAGGRIGWRRGRITILLRLLIVTRCHKQTEDKAETGC